MTGTNGLRTLAVVLLLAAFDPPARADDSPGLQRASSEFVETAKPLLVRILPGVPLDRGEGGGPRPGAVRLAATTCARRPAVWLKVAEMLDNRRDAAEGGRGRCPPRTARPSATGWPAT